MQEPEEGIGITRLLFLESTGQGGAVGSEKGNMGRNNMVKSVENAMWSQNMATHRGEPGGWNPGIGLSLITNSEWDIKLQWNRLTKILFFTDFHGIWALQSLYK